MTGSRQVVPLVAFAMFLLAGIATTAEAELIPSADGKTVFDTRLQVNWLRNSNLAGPPDWADAWGDRQSFLAQLAAGHVVSPNGAMNYNTAKDWIDVLKRNLYLGRSDWSLPTSIKAPSSDSTCSVPGGGPNHNSFGYNCTGSAMGSLYYQSLGLRATDTAVAIPLTPTGPFVNFQPYLYWSDTNNSFSFNTGWEGSNVDDHYMYVLPMVDGQLCHVGGYCPTFVASGVGTLQVSTDGLVVYDPDAVNPLTLVQGVTWLADANLAKTHKFGVQCLTYDPVIGVGVRCINRDGSMSHTTAQIWKDGMNAYNGGSGWLGSNQWKLPPIDVNDPCGIPAFNCTGSTPGSNPMGQLFYNQLGLSEGTPVVTTPNAFGGNLQPYLYWSCAESTTTPYICDLVDDHAATGFGFSFSFGNGFQGTTVIGADLYVTAYYPQMTADRLTDVLNAAYGSDPAYATKLANALALMNVIVTAPPVLKTFETRLFVRVVNADRRSGILTDAQADEIIALVRAL